MSCVFGDKEERTRNRFFKKTERDMATGCLLWMSCKNNRGYGVFSIHPRTAYAHRVAWALAKGCWPEKFLLHSCDTPLCVEISHLREGTAADNSMDMVMRGRQRSNPPKGIAHYKAKLNPEVVREIRESKESGPKIARRLGLHHSTIYDVRNMKYWVEDSSERRNGLSCHRAGIPT